MIKRTLEVTLPDDLDAEIAAAVSCGEHASAEEVVAGAVAQWRASRRLDASLDDEELRRLWREGIESGAGRNMSIDGIKGEAQRRFAQK
jgi:antitoxin ParD1/3/4